MAFFERSARPVRGSGIALLPEKSESKSLKCFSTAEWRVIPLLRF
jgi:hypothetical protein